MAKGPRGEKRPADAVARAVMVGKIATGEVVENLKPVSGKVRSGIAGSSARYESLSSERRSEIAANAAESRWRLKETSAVTNSGKERLLALLSGESRKLVNVKFMPGTGRSLTSDQLAGEAAAALQSALKKGPIDNPPLSGRQKFVLE